MRADTCEFLYHCITVDTEAFLSDPERLNKLFLSCKFVWESESTGIHSFACAAKLMEVGLALLQCQ